MRVERWNRTGRIKLPGHKKLLICFLQIGSHSNVGRTADAWRKVIVFQNKCTMDIDIRQLLWLNCYSASTKWSHHHRKHAILFDRVSHLDHTLDNSSIFSSNFHFQCLISRSSHSICTQLLQTCHSTLHQSLGAVEPMQIIPSLLHKRINPRKHI